MITLTLLTLHNNSDTFIEEYHWILYNVFEIIQDRDGTCLATLNPGRDIFASSSQVFFGFFQTVKNNI